MNKLRSTLLLFLFLVIFLPLTPSVRAQTIEYKPLTKDLPIFKTNSNGTVENPSELISRIYVLSIGVGAILAVIMITFSGIQYMTTEAITGKSDAKKRVLASFYGLLLLLGSYLILKTVNKKLVEVNINLPANSSTQTSSSGSSQTNSATSGSYCFKTLTSTICGSDQADCNEKWLQYKSSGVKTTCKKI